MGAGARNVKVLFDEETRKALVVIDLDTVMPGLVGHDFGDAIRFAANFVEEDSPRADLSLIHISSQAKSTFSISCSGFTSTHRP